MPKPIVPPPGPTLADIMAAYAELIAPVIDATRGHRATMEAAGFSPTCAEQMACMYHGFLLAQVMRGLS